MIKLGIPEIDEQHESFEKHLVELNKAVDDDALTYSLLLQMLKDLALHFTYEEYVFEKNGYGHSQAHIIEHGEILDNMVRMMRRLRSGKRDSIERKMIVLALQSLLIAHILDSDVKYANIALRKKWIFGKMKS